MHRYAIIRAIKAKQAKRKDETEMATLAMFKGILIRMKPEKNTRHHRAHIHAWYQGREATFDILSRKKIRGDFPQDQTYHVQSFIADYEAELLANWETINSESGTFFKIDLRK